MTSLPRRPSPGALLALGLGLGLTLAACGGGDRARPSSTSGSTPGASPGPSAGLPHLGLMTGTVYQTEEEFRAGEQLAKRYPGRVRHVTYPDNFMQEQETILAALASLASDPEVKVVVIGTAVPGSIAGARRVRAARPDILIGLVEPQEDPAIVNETADLALQPDQLKRGTAICSEAKAMGATAFVHYSFPRHMSQELLSRRRDAMQKTCSELGITFESITAPDPMGEGGLAATQQFVLEDVPREVARLGPATAFFSTNCGMQEPLIKAVLKAGAYLPEQCCPSPTHGYPGALGIGVPPDKAGDMAWIDAENRRVIREHGRAGHFGTWVSPEVMVSIRAVASLLLDAAEGKANHRDPATVRAYLEREAGAKVEMTRYDETRGNQYLFLLAHQVY